VKDVYRMQTKNVLV